MKRGESDAACDAASSITLSATLRQSLGAKRVGCVFPEGEETAGNYVRDKYSLTNENLEKKSEH
jgi:hypothetical protein